MVLALQLEQIRKDHDRRNFDCGIPALNEFLARYARQQHDRRLSRTYVAVDEANLRVVLAFFTLTVVEVDVSGGPVWVERYPHKVPGVRLARMAVDRRVQGRGIGASLIIAAAELVIEVADAAGAIGLFVDPKDERAEAFYRRFEFDDIVDEKGIVQLFLSLDACAALLASD